jgi:hypothetical protein
MAVLSGNLRYKLLETVPLAGGANHEIPILRQMKRQPISYAEAAALSYTFRDACHSTENTSM